MNGKQIILELQPSRQCLTVPSIVPKIKAHPIYSYLRREGGVYYIREALSLNSSTVPVLLGILIKPGQEHFDWSGSAEQQKIALSQSIPKAFSHPL